jgi:tetratricopeptide (TPR) repeat protein
VEALEAALARLEAAPGDLTVIGPLMDLLDGMGTAEQVAAVERAQRALSGEADSLVTLGQALYSQSFPGCELLGARVLVAALAVDPKVADGVTTLAAALSYVGRKDGEPLINEALEHTGRAPALLVEWGKRLIALGDSDSAETALLEAVRQDKSFSREATLAVCSYNDVRRLNNRTSRWLDRLEAVVGTDPDIINWRARLLSLRRQPHTAIPLLEEVLKRSPLEADRRADTINSLWSVRRELGQQTEMAILLDSLEVAVEDHWETPQDGRARIYHWRTQVDLYFRNASAAHRSLQSLREIQAETGLNVVDSSPAELALLALEGRTALLTEEEIDSANLRSAMWLLSDASARLPLVQEAIHRTDTADANRLCALYFELGIQLDSLHRLNEALEAYSRAHELWDSPAEEENFWQYGAYSLHNSAVSLESAGKYEDAIRMWRRAADAYDAALPTSDPYFHWARSSVYFRLDNPDAAYQACLDGLNVDGENIDLLLRIVELNKEYQGSRGRRRREFQINSQNRALASDNSSAESLAWRSRDAVRQLRPVLLERADQSRDASHHREFAEFLLDRADYRSARPYILTAIRLDPEDERNHKLMGRWYEKEGNSREALLAYQAALDLEPDDLQARSDLGQVHVSLGNRDAGRAEFVQVLETAPSHVETLIRLADVYTDLGDESDDGAYERAIELYDKALSCHRRGSGSKFLSTSEMASILYQRGYCRVKLYEATPNAFRSRYFLSTALKDFDECLSVDSSNDKARTAKRKLTSRGAQLLLSARERYGPWVIFACALFVFVLAQVQYLTHHISAVAHATLTLGGVVLAIAGLVLPELLRLKVGGIELEKSPVEQQPRASSFNLSR